MYRSVSLKGLTYKSPYKCVLFTIVPSLSIHGCKWTVKLQVFNWNPVLGRVKKPCRKQNIGEPSSINLINARIYIVWSAHRIQKNCYLKRKHILKRGTASLIAFSCTKVYSNFFLYQRLPARNLWAAKHNLKRI